MRKLALVVAVLVAVVSGCSGGGAGSRVVVGKAGRFPTGVFVAQYVTSKDSGSSGPGFRLSLFSVRAGARVRDLVYLPPAAAWSLVGYSRDAVGDVVYALAPRPVSKGNGTISNGGRTNGQCPSTSIYRISAIDGHARLLFQTPPGHTAFWPSASPNGRFIAYRSNPCTVGPRPEPGDVVVHDTLTGTDHRISVPNSVAGNIGWSRDGTQLIFTVLFLSYGPHEPSNAYVILPATAAGPQPRSALRFAPDKGCVVETATFDQAGVLQVEGCPDVVGFPARLIQLAANAHQLLWRTSTGQCPNGLTLAPQPDGTVLATSHTACGGRHVVQLTDVVTQWRGSHPTKIAAFINPKESLEAAY